MALHPTQVRFQAENSPLLASTSYAARTAQFRLPHLCETLDGHRHLSKPTTNLRANTREVQHPERTGMIVYVRNAERRRRSFEIPREASSLGWRGRCSVTPEFAGRYSVTPEFAPSNAPRPLLFGFVLEGCFSRFMFATGIVLCTALE